MSTWSARKLESHTRPSKIWSASSDYGANRALFSWPDRGASHLATARWPDRGASHLATASSGGALPDIKWQHYTHPRARVSRAKATAELAIAARVARSVRIKLGSTVAQHGIEPTNSRQQITSRKSTSIESTSCVHQLREHQLRVHEFG